MKTEMINNRDLITMKLLYYFITIKSYSPIIVQGAKNEIWLENLEEDVKIVRIANNYIHNDEQMDFDIFKTKRLVAKIKRKTFSFRMKVLDIFTDLGDNVNFNKLNNNDKIYEYIDAKSEDDILKNDFVNNNFPDLKNNFDFKEEGFALFLKITNEINAKNRNEAVKNEELFEPKKIIVTFIMLLILVLVYFVGNLTLGGSFMIDRFAVYGPYVRGFHEYYRLLTGTFLHGNLFHLLSNCYALYIIGTQIESFYGKAKFIVIYLFSAICGSLMSIALSDYASVGASGAIFGLMGSLLYFGYYYRVYLGSTWKTNIIPVIVINLVLGFLVPGIDYFAHIGGLIGGVLISMALGLKYKERKSDQVNGIILSVIFIVFLAYLGIFMK